MAEIKSESVADFMSESVAGFPRNTHPEQGYRACIGILRLARQYGADRLEAACDRGLDIGARSYGSIKSSMVSTGARRPGRRHRASCCLTIPISAAPATTIDWRGD